MGISLFQILFCDFLYLFAFLMLFQVMQGKIVARSHVRWAFMAMALMCFFAFITGDYWHYKEFYEVIKLLDRTHIEAVYQDIARLSPTYLVFRVIIWGGALVFLSFIFKLTNVDYAVALFLFITRYFLIFSYARVSLSMAMAFFGLALVCKARGKEFLNAIIGFALIGLSYYFHKSAVFGISICLISIVFVKQNRFNLIALIVLIPLVVTILSKIIDLYMVWDFEDNDVMIQNGQNYITRNSGRYQSFSKNIIDFIWRFPYFLIIVMYIKTIAYGRFNDMPLPVRVFANAAFFSVFISAFFLISSIGGVFILYYRFLNFAMIPSVIFVTYCYSNRMYPIMVRLFYYLSFIGVVLSLAYRLVTWI